MGKIVVIGSSNTDMVLRSQKIPAAGETVLGMDFTIVQGGKGANQAVAAARAGGDVTFIARLGNDEFGKQAIQGYKKDGIDTDYIQLDPAKPTGVAVIIVDVKTGQNSIVVAPGSNGCLSVNDIRSAEGLIKDADLVLMQLEIPLDVVQFALVLAKKHGVKTILNPAPARVVGDDFLRLVDIITPNETEAEILTGIRPVDESSAREAAIRLLAKVNEAVLITMGSQGVYFISRNGKSRLVPAKKVKAIDTTAAGDVFNGYFACALANGSGYDEAILLANKAAAISVTRSGAQPSIPYASELKEETDATPLN